MAAHRPTWLSLYVVIALIVGVIAASSVEAAVCAPELAGAHLLAAQAVDAGDDDLSRDDAKGADHGPCSHGHCHHGGADRLAASADPLSMTFSEDRPIPVVAHLRSHAVEGLKRPPRA